MKEGRKKRGREEGWMKERKGKEEDKGENRRIEGRKDE